MDTTPDERHNCGSEAQMNILCNPLKSKEEHDIFHVPLDTYECIVVRTRRIGVDIPNEHREDLSCKFVQSKLFPPPMVSNVLFSFEYVCIRVVLGYSYRLKLTWISTTSVRSN